VIVLLITLLVLSNIAWIIVWNQFDYAEEMINVDGGSGVANYIGNDGDITYGEDNEKEEDMDTPRW
jgi:hypothetical protein